MTFCTPMNPNTQNTKAISIAIEAINQSIHKIAVDANLCDIYGATYPHAKKASAKRREYLEAISVLNELKRGL